VPSVRFETLRRVVGEPAARLAVDRDAVVVVESDQLAELLRSGERAHLVRDAFHQATVAQEDVGVVVDDRRVGPIELGGEVLFRERHADGVRYALPERPRRGFDAERKLALRMARDARAELAKVLELVDVDLVAREIRDRIEQHRAVPIRQHEPIAVVPVTVRGVETQVVVPEHLGDVGHAHRHAWVPRFGGLDRVHRQHANRVREPTAIRPRNGGRVITAHCHRLSTRNLAASRKGPARGNVGVE
jgi:hypothetical protein